MAGAPSALCDPRRSLDWVGALGVVQGEASLAPEDWAKLPGVTGRGVWGGV